MSYLSFISKVLVVSFLTIGGIAFDASASTDILDKLNQTVQLGGTEDYESALGGTEDYESALGGTEDYESALGGTEDYENI